MLMPDFPEENPHIKVEASEGCHHRQAADRKDTKPL